MEQAGRSADVLRPLVRLREGPAGLRDALRPLCRRFGIGGNQLRQAVRRAWAAWDEFHEACLNRGREVLADLAPADRAVVLVSRPYNGCDPGAYLNLPAKLRGLGILPIPLDFLDLSTPHTNGDGLLKGIYWSYGQRILRAADVIRADRRLYAVYLSNFSCGPDSFLTNYFRRRMSPKPTLVLEIDEHSADAGLVTRLEAFLESIQSAASPQRDARRPPSPCKTVREARRTIHIPWMGDQSYGLAAVFRAYGQRAEVIPPADQQSIQLGRRHVSGKECLPCIVTAGDMIRTTQRPGFDPDTAAFFMPGGCGPCRFGQYSWLHQLILDDLGLPHVPVVSPAHDEKLYDDFRQFRGDIINLGWYAVCVFDLLLKARLELRPYEVEAGQTDALYETWCRRMCELIETRPRERQLLQQMVKAAADFAAIAVDRRQVRPRLGVVGEIYIRHHSVANGDLLRQLEDLGAATVLASYPEWHHYTNWVRVTDARRAGNLKDRLLYGQKDRVQRQRHRRLAAVFGGLVEHPHETPTKALLKLAQPYLDPHIKGGDAVLSVARMIEMHREGCQGVINVMPFGCMPSAVVDSLMKTVSRATGQMPLLSISYDGGMDPMLRTRLEAFVHQAREYQGNGARHRKP
jgi:predicted nucleotide-binding protein (sugar kinase/HSP70/actin superfamily)